MGFIKSILGIEEDYISYKITKAPFRAEQEEIIRKNLMIIDRTCPCCGNVREEGDFDGCAPITDLSYNYMYSKCPECGAEWETKVKRMN